ncbi:MAG: hypothetical protein ACQETF_12630 [Bacteroidota bacterium]
MVVSSNFISVSPRLNGYLEHVMELGVDQDLTEAQHAEAKFLNGIDQTFESER